MSAQVIKNVLLLQLYASLEMQLIVNAPKIVPEMTNATKEAFVCQQDEFGFVKVMQIVQGEGYAIWK